MVKVNKVTPFYFLAAGLFIWFAVNLFYGERVLANNGFGWDGVSYANIAAHFGDFLKTKLLESYRAQRIFPSFVVYLSSKCLNYSLENPATLVRAFYIYNVLMILSGVYALFLIAKLRHWKLPTLIIAFSGLFLSYGILKMSVYYTILTDYSAFVLGIWMLYFYLRNSILGLSIITIIGAFTFPTMLISGILLLLLPKNSVLHSTESSRIGLTLHISLSRVFLSISVALLACLFAMYSLKTIHPSQFSVNYRTLYAGIIGQIPSIQSAWLGYISIVGLFLYFTFGLMPFIRKKITMQITFARIVYSIVIVGLVLMMQHRLVNPALPPILTALPFFKYAYGGALINPFIFVVAHFVYYGPIILWVILYWNKIVATAYEEGIGLAALLFLYVFLLVGPESRQYFNIISLFVFFVCEILNKKNVSLGLSYLMMALSIAVSKCWLLINPHAWGYSMSQGQGMHNDCYFIQLVVMFIIFGILYSSKKRMDQSSHSSLYQDKHANS